MTKSDLRVLAEAVVRSDWFHRAQAAPWTGHTRDEAWCDLCDGRGYYSDYSLTWHDSDCPLRLACSILGTDDPLGKHNALMDVWLARRERRRAKAAARESVPA